MLKKMTPSNTLSTIPSRHLRFVLDPKCVPALSHQSQQETLSFIADLCNTSPDIDINLLLPNYLKPSDHKFLGDRLGDSLLVFEEAEDFKSFIPSIDLPKQDHVKLTKDSPECAYAISLLSLADSTQSDGIITESNILIDTRWSLRQIHRIRTIPISEFGDILEIFAHGNMLFWSTKNSERKTTIDTYYATTNKHCRRYLQWILDYSKSCDNKLLKTELHSALVNRYSFLLYARDMVRFYEIQLDYFWRRGLMQRFVFPLGYHVTHFYLLLWGMLEQLTIIAKHKCRLELKNRACGIRKIGFWKQIEEKKPNLNTFIKKERIANWVEQMADMRHSAAHQTIPLPTMVLQETEESEKDETEIREELKKKFPALYSHFPDEYIRALEPEMIIHWRTEHMKTLFSTSVLIKNSEKKSYFRDPVASIDYDLETLTEVINVFLGELFEYNAQDSPSG